MPTPTKGPRLGGSPDHQRLLLANLATALFEHGRIRTTHAKAKALRPMAEKLITFAKRGDVAARRQVLTVVRRKDVVHTLFAEIGPRYAERLGGYTRITKLGPRKGDNAPMAMIELVEATTIAQQAVSEGERARGTRFVRRKGQGSAAAASATAAVAQEAAVDEDLDIDAGGAGDQDITTEPDDGATDVSGGDTPIEESPEEVATDEPASADEDSGAGNQAESASETSQAEGEPEPDDA